jgi:hypothetical protein
VPVGCSSSVLALDENWFEFNSNGSHLRSLQASASLLQRWTVPYCAVDISQRIWSTWDSRSAWSHIFVGRRGQRTRTCCKKAQCGCPSMPPRLEHGWLSLSGSKTVQKLLFKREEGIMIDGLQLTFQQPRGGCDARLDLKHVEEARRQGRLSGPRLSLPHIAEPPGDSRGAQMILSEHGVRRGGVRSTAASPDEHGAKIK